jgi:O-antigen/teichoic acid export membrane protein
LDRLYLAGALFLRIFSGIAFLLLFARVLPISDYGFVVSCIAYSTVVLLVTDFGGPIRLVREIASGADADRVINSAISNKNTAFVIATPIYVLAMLVSLGIGGHFAVAVLVYGAVSINSYADFVLLGVRARSYFRLEAIIVVLSNAAFIFCISFVALLLKDVVWLAVSLFSARFIQFVMTYLGSYRVSASIKWFAIGKIYSRKSEDSRSFGYAVDGVLSSVLSQIDIILVGWLLGLQAVGVYQLGARLAAYALLPTQVLAGIYIPQLSRAFREQGHLKHRMSRAVAEFAIVGIVTGAFFALASRQIVAQVFGPDFQATQAFWLAMGSVIALRYCAAALGVMLVASGRVAMRIFGQAVAIGIIVSLFIVVLPGRGIDEAVYIVAVATMMTLLVFGFGVWRALRD